MSTHNICFCGEIKKKYLTGYPLSAAMRSFCTDMICYCMFSNTRLLLALVLLNKLRCHAPLLIFIQSDYLIQVVYTHSNTEWQTVQIQISWLLQKPTDMDLHCLQRQGIFRFSRTRVSYVIGHGVVYIHAL